MYESYDIPQFGFSIFYYDYEYEMKTSKKVLEILEKYGFYPAEKIHADWLTNNKFEPFDEGAKELFIRAYSEKDVLGIAMEGKNNAWQFFWSFTFYKESECIVNPVFKPWNIISIYITHEEMNNNITYKNCIKCLKELIKAINPFYADIDDIACSNKYMKKTKERHFVSERIQTIYWGNYLGKEHCEKYGLEYIKKIPAYSVEQIGEGVFFTLSSSLIDYNKRDTLAKRRRVKRYLNKKNSFFKRIK